MARIEGVFGGWRGYCVASRRGIIVVTGITPGAGGVVATFIFASESLSLGSDVGFVGRCWHGSHVLTMRRLGTLDTYGLPPHAGREMGRGACASGSYQSLCGGIGHV